VLLRKVDPPEILRRIRAHRVTMFCGAPTVLLMIAEHPDAQGVRFDPPVRVATGGAPPSPTILARMEKMGVRTTHLYGLTETYGPHLYCAMQREWEDLDVDAKARVMARQGVPTHNATHVRVVDDAMNDVPADAATMGEVVMRGNNVMAGYYADPEATAEAFRGGWFHSGDIGVVHPDGYVELREASGPDDEYFEAKVTVLSEMIKHHVKEEEQRGGMFAKAKQADMDLTGLGEQLKRRKDQVMAEIAGESDERVEVAPELLPRGGRRSRQEGARRSR
jgi:acyl-CoA synthetase (AMP-forming)/AMP-acid ligase II